MLSLVKIRRLKEEESPSAPPLFNVSVMNPSSYECTHAVIDLGLNEK